MNQIENTALGYVRFNESIDSFFRTAILSELKYAGYRQNADSPRIKATINNLLIDDLGYSVDWTMSVTYLITSTTGEWKGVTVTTNKNTDKFIQPLTTVNYVFRLNIEEFMLSQVFQDLIEKK